jgi:hypothetical protein
MPRTQTREAMRKVEAVEACVVVVGARPPEYRTAIVRDRHTGKLAEVTLNEYPPIDEGDDGMTYVFKKGEQVRADHPAVADCPSAFAEIDPDEAK